MTQTLRIFVSATTRDLGSYRRAVADWLRAQGHEPVVQDEFAVEPDFVTISRMLLDQLKGCDAVVCLIGDHYGAEPKDFPAGEARRSYTQLEYELGRTLKRSVYLFFTAPECPRDNPPADGDPGHLQKAYRDRLQQRNEIWYSFGSCAQLLGLMEKLSFRPAVGRPNNLPFESLGSLFKGRDEFLDRLRASLTERPTHAAAVFSRQAIHGLGGVGKTRAAVEYGLRFAAEYTALLFVTADSPSALTGNLANLCGALVLNLPERDETNVNVQAAAALRWLERNPGWFLILDNVDTPEAAAEVEKLLGRLTAGHTVVTSRLSSWGAEVEPLELDVLHEGPAAEFLLERTAGKRRATPTDPDEASGLARDLDGLALALEQAGAFVARHRCSFADYRARWRAQEAKVLEWHDPRAMKYPRSVATTWQTSVGALGDDGRGLLRVLCWLAPEPVPLTMLAKLGTPEGAAPIDTELACAELADYSLVKWTDGNAAVKAHRLILDVTRYRLPDVASRHWFARGLRRLLFFCRMQTDRFTRRGWLVRALAMVNDFVVENPQDVRNWREVCDPAGGHALAVTTHADAAGIAEPTSRLMNQLGLYHNARADFAAAEPLYRRALAIAEANYGSHHHQVASRLSNLAVLLRATNRHAEAEPLYARVICIFEASYGLKHPSTALAVNNLAALLRATNRHAEAESLFRRALAINEANSGPQHPSVAATLNNLAELLRATNRHAEAEPLVRRALAIGEASYGLHHPEVARGLSNLAGLLRATGRPAEAEPMHRRALAIDEAAYGPDHPEVAAHMNRLALLLAATNRPAEAEPLVRRALAIGEASYGPDHPTVAAYLNDLAELLRETGRHTEAESLYRRALAIDEASYGPQHPNVAIRLNNLALLLRTANRPSEAEPPFRRALAINEASYGPQHPNVACNLSNLAGLLRSTGRPAEAEPLVRRALAIDEASYGPDHPNVAIRLNNLATLLEATGRHTEAEPLFARAVRILCTFRRRNAHEHPAWQTCRKNYLECHVKAFGVTRKQALTRLRDMLGLDPLADGTPGSAP